MKKAVEPNAVLVRLASVRLVIDSGIHTIFTVRRHDSAVSICTSVRLSVCLSVTSRYFSKTAKRRVLKQRRTMVRGTLVF